jgi:hypothetical protein
MNEENQSNTSDLENQGRGVSMDRIDDGAISDDHTAPQIDDRGTDQSEAARILKRIRDEVFDSSDEKLALALGRSSEEIAEWLNGEGTIDGDALMKVRALARERN